MIKEMLSKQIEVDCLIQEKYNGDFRKTLSKRIIAFKIEVSELANEIASFKYWKESHVKNKERILEEASDCLAFLFSIVNSYELNKRFYRLTKNHGDYEIKEFNLDKTIDLNIKFLLETEIDQDVETLQELFSTICWLVNACGYTGDELFKQYFVKCEENIRRAKEGY